MKKTILLLAMSTAFAGSAFAQSSTVTMYGIADMGVAHESGGAAGSQNKVSSGIASQSRIGFKGVEDLGNGLSAKFQIESGFAADTGATIGTMFGRQAFVGVSSKEMGSVTAGRQYSFLFETLRDVADPFATGMAGRANNIVDAGSNNTLGVSNIRTSNVVKYVTPSIQGFTMGASYGAGEVAGDAAGSRSVGLTGSYAAGPLVAAVSFSRVNNVDNSDNVKNTLVAGSYDFGMVKANLAMGFNKGIGAADSRDYIVGMTVPVTATTKVMASYVRKNDRSVANNDADQFGIGVDYSLTKRTDLYTSYARISNKNGAAYTVGNNSEVGSGNKQFNVGLRHAF